jgi:hypothetical protein
MKSCGKTTRNLIMALDRPLFRRYIIGTKGQSRIQYAPKHVPFGAVVFPLYFTLMSVKITSLSVTGIALETFRLLTCRVCLSRLVDVHSLGLERLERLKGLLQRRPHHRYRALQHPGLSLL